MRLLILGRTGESKVLTNLGHEEVPEDEVPGSYWNRLVAWIKCAQILEETDKEPPEPLA